jgi:hypothetical protein
MPVGTLLLRPLPEREQIEAAIQNHERALASASTQGQERTRLLADLGTALYERYRSASDARDLDRAILYIQEARTAVDLLPTTQGALDFELAIYLHDRHLLRGAASDLEQSILLAQRAATLITEVEDRVRVLNTLGILLAAHYERTGRLDELNRCIDTLEEAVALLPVTSQQRPVLLNNLAGTLWQRYERTGDGADLERAARYSPSSVDRLTAASRPSLEPTRRSLAASRGRTRATWRTSTGRSSGSRRQSGAHQGTRRPSSSSVPSSFCALGPVAGWRTSTEQSAPWIGLAPGCHKPAWPGPDSATSSLPSKRLGSS